MKIKVSVIMSVYNTKEEYLRAAIESILNQTLSDFEFIIFDDASDESTKRVLKSYQDSRIKLIQNEINKGLTYNLNRGLEIARGQYIARMDADDISYSKRFQKMAAVLDKHKTVQVLGCYSYSKAGLRKWYGNIPQKVRKARFLLENTGIAHPTLFIRKDFLQKNNICYDEMMKKAQDYKLWTQCIKYANIFVYPQNLFFYRVHDSQISNIDSEGQNYYTNKVRERLLEEFGNELSEKEKTDFIRSRRKCDITLKEYEEMERKILSLNDKYKVYDKGALRYVLKWNKLRYIKYNITPERKMYLTALKEAVDFNLYKHLIINVLCQNTIVNWWILARSK